MMEALDIAAYLAALVACGALFGMASGALRIGGGVALAPLLHGALEAEPHVALGTATAAIGLSALWAARAHRANGTEMGAALKLAPVAALGGAAGGAALALASPDAAMVLWGVALFAAALMFGLDDMLARGRLEASPALAIGGALGLGAASGGAALGAGAMGAPLLARLGVTGRDAAAATAVLGAASSIPAAAAFALLAPGGGAPFTIGGIDPVGAVLLPVIGAAVAPHGARLAREVPMKIVRLALAFLLLVAALSLISAGLGR